MAKIIAIANQKGGVGKTTTAVNLSVGLAQNGQKTLLVDVDPQGNATSGIGITKSELPRTVYEVLINGLDAKDAIVTTDFGPDVLPANIALAGAEIELVAALSREMRLKKALDKLEGYDYIIIDCPPSLGLLTINSLTAAGSIIVPIQCEFYALEGVTQLMNTIELVQNNLNAALKIEGIVLTMYDPRTKLSEQVVQEVRKAFEDLVYQTLIPRTVRLSEAPSYGQPILFYDKRSRGNEVYLELAREVLTRGQ